MDNGSSRNDFSRQHLPTTRNGSLSRNIACCIFLSLCITHNEAKPISANIVALHMLQHHSNGQNSLMGHLLPRFHDGSHISHSPRTDKRQTLVEEFHHSRHIFRTVNTEQRTGISLRPFAAIHHCVCHNSKTKRQKTHQSNNNSHYCCTCFRLVMVCLR